MLNKRGFSLIELAIALVVLGILFSLSLPSLGWQREQQQYGETRQLLAAAEEALLGFAAIYGRLPRPAASFSNGEEKSVECSNDAACTGFLPWQTLGTRSTDAWGKLLRYSVTPAFTRQLAAGEKSFDLTSSGSKKIQTRDASGALVYLVGGSDSCSKTPCALAVIYSSGRNNWGTLADGTALGNAASGNVDESSNNAADKLFISRPPGKAAAGGEFDDLVTWLPLTIFTSRMVSAGRLP